jgi:hypothetical protein
MKTFSDEALAALQRGDAIVSASVEIIPSAAISYSTVGIYDLDAVTNCGGALTDAMTVGITVSGFDPADTMRITLPTGQTFTAWNYEGGISGGWLNEFDVVPDGVAANSVRLSQRGTTVTATSNHSDSPGGFSSAEAARAAFGSHTLTGASDYTLWFKDTVPGGGSGAFDNSGGLSVRVERGILVVGAGNPINLWGGYGAADLPSDEGTSTFQGIGDRGLINQSAGAIGGSAQNLTLSLSGIEPAALELLDPSEVKGASAVVRRLIYDSAGKTLLGAYVYTRGRVDELKTSEVVGGSATIELSIEGAARGLGRRGGRIRSDADQRLVSATDGFYRVVSAAPKKTLYWGGKRPSVAGSAVGGGGGSSSGTSPSSF